MLDASLKLNLGCGYRKKQNFINVDHDANCLPDAQLDLAKERWPWADHSADEISFEYSMEQMGHEISHLRHVISETFRVGKPGAKVSIVATHPRHDHFVNNPACTHRLSPDFFQTLAVGRNLDMIANGQHHDVFAFKWGVNFAMKRLKFLIAPMFQEDVESGRISEEEIRRRMQFEHNICQAFEVDLEVLRNQDGARPTDVDSCN